MTRSHRQRCIQGSLAVLLYAGCGVFEFRTPVEVDALPEDDECQMAKPGTDYTQQYCWDGRKQGATPPSCMSVNEQWSANPSMGTWGPTGSPALVGSSWKCALKFPKLALTGQQVVVRMEHQRNIPLGFSDHDLKPAYEVGIDIFSNSGDPLAVWKTSTPGYVVEELSVKVPQGTSITLAPALSVETLLGSTPGFSWQLRHLSIWTKPVP